MPPPIDQLDPAWPRTLTEEAVVLRPLARRHQTAWTATRERNRAWLEPWDATTPPGSDPGPPDFRTYVRRSLRAARRGLMFPWVIEYGGDLVGQLNVGAVTLGAVLSGAAGYWVAQDVAGRGIVPTAVALAFDHVTGPGGLHRLEIAIRPENKASLRVVEKLGFRDEGVRQRYLHVAGAWRDHRVFALTREEVPDGLVERWRQTRRHGAAG
jgi:ribosomal-protein-alanine N-acetyltransferase